MSQTAPGQPDNPMQQPPKRRGRVGRILAFIASGILGLVGLVAGCAVMLTQDVTAAGNKFLAEVTSPDPTPAWRGAGPDLQRAIDEAGFRRWVADHGLQGGKVSFWSSRNRNNGEGSLAGTMNLRDGRTVPLRLILRQDPAGLWQVIGISVNEGGGSATGTRN